MQSLEWWCTLLLPLEGIWGTLQIIFMCHYVIHNTHWGLTWLPQVFQFSVLRCLIVAFFVLFVCCCCCIVCFDVWFNVAHQIQFLWVYKVFLILLLNQGHWKTCQFYIHSFSEYHWGNGTLHNHSCYTLSSQYTSPKCCISKSLLNISKHISLLISEPSCHELPTSN